MSMRLYLPGGETEYEEKTLVQSMKVLTEINLRTLQDKIFLAWDQAGILGGPVGHNK